LFFLRLERSRRKATVGSSSVCSAVSRFERAGGVARLNQQQHFSVGCNGRLVRHLLAS